MGMKVLLAQDIDISGKQLLLNAGYELVLAPQEDPEVMKACIADCEGVISKTFFLTEEILRAGKKLKVVGKHGVGIDNVVDLDTATKLGLYVVNTPYANMISVAEHTIAGLLAFSKKILFMDTQTRLGNFEANAVGDFHDVAGKTIGLIGAGNIGRSVAKIAALGLDMNVIAYDPFVKQDALPEYIHKKEAVEEVLEEADFVTLHLAATADTIHMMDLSKFRRMKPSAVFLNFARGGLVVEADLVQALQENIIRGAVLDVFAEEPPARDNPLFRMENVLLSPHSAACTDEALQRTSYDVAKGIVQVLSGNKPSWCPNYGKVQNS